MIMCENCGVKPATVHMVSYINGQKKESHLCHQCAQKLKNAKAGFSVADLFGSFFDIQMQPDLTASEPVCEQCGMTLSEFKQHGKLGCENCYSTFRDALMPVIKRIHGRVSHTGKSPYKSKKQNRAASQLEKLKKELEDAVMVENYEQAAKLRDKIKTLEAGE